MGLFDTLRKSIQDLGDQVKSKQRQLEQLKRKREDIAYAPAARADVKALLGEWIDACGTRYAEMLQQHLAAVLAKPQSFKDACAPNAENYLAIVAVRPNQANPPTPRTLDTALCALLGPQLKAAVHAAIDAMNWPAAEGMRIVEREKALTKIDAEIAALQAELDELEQVAASNRIALP